MNPKHCCTQIIIIINRLLSYIYKLKWKYDTLFTLLLNSKVLLRFPQSQ